MFDVLPVFDATSTSSTADATSRYMSVSTSTALSTTEASVGTTLTAVQAGTYSGITITQGANSPAGTTFRYTLRQNAGNTNITCTIGPGNSTCTDTNHTVALAGGDTIDVLVVRSAGTGTLTATFRVQLDPWPAATASAGLAAPGGHRRHRHRQQSQRRRLADLLLDAHESRSPGSGESGRAQLTTAGIQMRRLGAPQ
jgi:hypothetical protein